MRKNYNLKQTKLHFKPISLENLPIASNSQSSVQTVSTDASNSQASNFSEEFEGYNTSSEEIIFIQSDPSIGLNTFELNPNIIQPVINFPMTKFGKQNRKFNSDWYSLHCWLEYSVSTDKAYCRYCRIFSKSAEAFPFSKNGFNNWKNAKEKMQEHSTSKSHFDAAILFESRVKQNENKTSISSIMISYSAGERRKNRQHLKNVVSCVLYLAKQGIALRGNDEKKDSENQGHFLELLKFKSEDIPALKDRLESDHAIRYTGAESQNEIIIILGAQILKLIIEEIGINPYSIIIDETTDVSTQEQVAFCIRYVYRGEIKERFIKFNVTASTTGKALELEIIETLQQLGLSGNYLVGQAYDGASNMSGRYNGVAALVRAKFSKAIYIHCYAHRLNLALQAACSAITEIRNALGTINSVHSFIGASAKRHTLFKDIATLEECYLSLKVLSETRWASRKHSFTAMKFTYSSVLKCLKKIDEEDKSKAGANAKSLSIAINQFEYLFVVYMLTEIFSITGNLSQALQEVELDVISAQNMVESTLSALEEVRNSDKFEVMYNECIQFAEQHSMEIPKLGRQVKPPVRFNATSKPTFSTSKEKFHSLFLQTIDLTMKEIKDRFIAEKIQPIIKMTEVLKYGSIEALDSLSESSIYNDLLDFNIMKSELALWVHSKESVSFQEILKSNRSKKLEARKIQPRVKSTRTEKIRLQDEKIARQQLLPYSTYELYKAFYQLGMPATFPQLNMLFGIYLAIPVSNCSSERGFSALKRIKNWMRNTMGEQRLSSLAILNIEKDLIVAINLEAVISVFASLKDRKCQF